MRHAKSGHRSRAWLSVSAIMLHARQPYPHLLWNTLWITLGQVFRLAPALGRRTVLNWRAPISPFGQCFIWHFEPPVA